MSYLIASDYKKQIQVQNLAQITGGDNSILLQWQLAAQEKCVSYLVQKYDTESEFTNTSIWDKTKIYYAGSRVYLDAEPYLITISYTAGAMVTYANNVYTANQTTTIGQFDEAKWDLIGQQYAIFYSTYPYPIFNINLQYPTGSHVYWKGKSYQSINSSENFDPIQYPQYANLPARNYFPDYLVNGQPNSQWGTGTPHTIPAGTPLSDELWTAGDNRSQQLVQTCIDIVLYYVHQRISPMNIPELRKNNYNMAIQWLMDASTGHVTPNLPVKQPNQGHRIRIGGNVKLNNSY